MPVTIRARRSPGRGPRRYRPLTEDDRGALAAEFARHGRADLLRPAAAGGDGGGP